MENNHKFLGLRKSILVLGVMGSWLFSFSAQSVEYPYVTGVQGKVLLTTEGAKEFSLKGPLTLKKKATLKTSSASEVKVLLDAERFLVVRPSSEVQLPIISQETGQVPVLLLKKGEIYISQGQSYNMALRSDLNEFITPKGRYLLGFDPKKATSWVKVLEGTFEFSAMNFEKSVTVKAGEQVSFNGVIEDGEIAYDVLLKGKKVPRGDLSKVTAVVASDMQLYSPEKLKKAEQDAQKKRDAVIAKAKEAQAKYVCQTPPAEFNQCMWVLEKNICYRFRCNANGDWAEKTEVAAKTSGLQCSKEAFIASCDY